MSLLDTGLHNARRWARVGDFYEITRKPRALTIPARVSFVSMDAVPEGGAFEPRYDEKAADALTSRTYFERGDILVAKITPSFENGKQALTEAFSHPFGFATTEVIPLRPKDPRHDRRLLFFYLLHPDVRTFVADKMEGATGRQRVPESVLLDLPFPDISGHEQRAIANVLGLVQEAMKVERECSNSALHLKRASMRALFTQGLRGERQKETEIGLMPEGWYLESLAQHYSIVSGGTPSRGNPSYWEGGTIPWVKTAEVNYGLISATEERITETALQESAAKMLPVGTLLMAMYGQGVTRGRVAILGLEAACNQACAAMNPKDNAIDPRYLFFFLTFRYEEIRRLAHGGQQQNLNLDIVRALPVAYPPDVSDQQEIVAVIEAITRTIEVHQRKSEVLEELFKALLHKLVTGDIRVSDLDLSVLPPAGSQEGSA